jgi:glycosyltransferase involved in cell wall biosynthesis
LLNEPGQMKLLAIIEAYTITGPAKNLIEFAGLARAEGAETTIGTFVRGQGTNLFIETARAAGIQVETVEEGGPGDPRVRGKLRELVARVKPDVLQTHAVKSHFLARSAGLHRRVPWVTFHHGYTWPALRARLYNQLDRWSLPAARKVLTVSAQFRDELIAKGVLPDRIEIIQNSIRPDWGEAFKMQFAGAQCSELRSELGIADGRRVILAVGRLSREKDHMTLLAAMAGLEQRSCQLVIVGDGPERGRIEREIARLGLSGSVTLTGQRDSAERFYAIADIAVLPSVTEGSSNALLEAMAAGVPVVATAVGGTPEIVTHEESALLVPPGNAGEMGAAIRRLATDAELGKRLAERSRQLIREQHAPDARARRLIGIYREIAGARTQN